MNRIWISFSMWTHILNLRKFLLIKRSRTLCSKLAKSNIDKIILFHISIKSIYSKSIICKKKNILVIRRNILLYTIVYNTLHKVCPFVQHISLVPKKLLFFLPQKNFNLSQKKIIFAAKNSHFVITKTYFFVQKVIFLWAYYFIFPVKR